jgi:hypothetical protein
MFSILVLLAWAAVARCRVSHDGDRRRLASGGRLGRARHEQQLALGDRAEHGKLPVRGGRAGRCTGSGQRGEARLDQTRAACGEGAPCGSARWRAVEPNWARQAAGEGRPSQTGHGQLAGGGAPCGGARRARGGLRWRAR